MVHRGEYRVASARQTPESQLLVPSANWQALAGATSVGPHRARRKVLLNYRETRKAAAQISVNGVQSRSEMLTRTDRKNKTQETRVSFIMAIQWILRQKDETWSLRGFEPCAPVFLPSRLTPVPSRRFKITATPVAQPRGC